MSNTFEMIVKITGNLRKHGMYIKNLILLPTKNNPLNRNHCWVEYSKTIEELRIVGHQKPVYAAITCSIIKYKRRGDEESTTLKIHTANIISNSKRKQYEEESNTSEKMGSNDKQVLQYKSR